MLALDSTEYLATKGKADNGNGFLLMEEVVETRDEARGLTVSAEGRSGSGPGWKVGDDGDETSDGDEAEGVSEWGSGRDMARDGGGCGKGSVGNRDGGECVCVCVDSGTLNPVISGAMIRLD